MSRPLPPQPVRLTIRAMSYIRVYFLALLRNKVKSMHQKQKQYQTQHIYTKAFYVLELLIAMFVNVLIVRVYM